MNLQADTPLLIILVPCFVALAACIIGLMWCVWGIRCNNQTYNQRMALLDAMKGRDDFWRLHDYYSRVTYNEHCSANEWRREWRDLYHADLICAFDNARSA